jgi:glycerophosphoryl diester phosphodiesterase
MPLRIAHRGMPRRIRENTLPSFALAIEAGADGLELDVHATRDGVVVVHHDPTLADGSAITALSFAEVRRREAAPGIPIPTLAEVCALAGEETALFVELKGAGIESLVVDVLGTHRGEVAIHSFDHAMIARLHAMGCRYPLGILFEDAVGDLPRLMETTGATDVWPHFPLVTPSLLGAVHARGGRVITWTVNDLGIARALADGGVDGLCGDDVTIFE